MSTVDGLLDRGFGALSDPSRRRLLELLLAEPGATTGELVAQLPGLSRWAVMKHVGVLQRAGLVIVLPEGRRRRHYADLGRMAAISAWLTGLAAQPPM